MFILLNIRINNDQFTFERFFLFHENLLYGGIPFSFFRLYIDFEHLARDTCCHYVFVA